LFVRLSEEVLRRFRSQFEYLWLSWEGNSSKWLNENSMNHCLCLNCIGSSDQIKNTVDLPCELWSFWDINYHLW
jgi:hypothetical protein